MYVFIDGGDAAYSIRYYISEGSTVIYFYVSEMKTRHVKEQCKCNRDNTYRRPGL